MIAWPGFGHREEGTPEKIGESDKQPSNERKGISERQSLTTRARTFSHGWCVNMKSTHPPSDILMSP
jgi:hypothetical protein